MVDDIDEPDSPPPIPPPLEVVKVDSNIEENRRAHHTDRYEESGLIIRRGQTFSLTVTTKEPVSGRHMHVVGRSCDYHMTASLR